LAGTESAYACVAGGIAAQSPARQRTSIAGAAERDRRIGQAAGPTRPLAGDLAIIL